ncbi:3-oxoacyl-[acyl-carrier-protein] synthase 3 [Phycisphaerae bacterium RAS1]|nr:3-oxoacyl-[acyl-carrier-protein] synthase 3 [Phycisphaerae bacterium RAS1]
MKLDWPIEIIGAGVSLPTKAVSNADFCKRLDTTEEWITQRTGILSRRMAAPEESTLTLAVDASRQAIAEAGLTPKDLDMIVLGTITPEHALPATSCELQAALGCRWIPAFDLVAACSGFVWSFVTAAHYVHTGMAGNVLVVGAETLTRITDMEDRGTAILFGDGAGAVVIRKSADPHRRLLAARMGSDGERGMLIWIPAGGAKEPASVKSVNERLHYMRMKGREVYKFAVTQFQELIAETLDDAGVKIEDVKLVVPHQSNMRIIESACERFGLPREKVVINIDRYGNTSAASIPIAFWEAKRDGRFQPGDLVLLVAFGAGLTWGSALLRV